MKRIMLAVASMGIASGACVSKTTGNEGNFEFSYPADDRVGDFNKPIAVGAFLDLEVRDVGDRSPVALDSASFVDPSVFKLTPSIESWASVPLQRGPASITSLCGGWVR